MLFETVWGWVMLCVIGFAIAVLSLRMVTALFSIVGGVIFVLLCVLVLAGCAGSQLTPDEREYRRAMTMENYRLCTKVYRENHQVFLHRGHTHDLPRMVRIHDYRDDLEINSCRRVLGEHWAE